MLGLRFSPRALLGLVAATGVVAYLAWWYWDENLRLGSLGNPIVMTPETPGPGIGIDCLAFSPDGWILATGDLHRTVSLWDVATERKLCELDGHASSVFAIGFSPDSRTLASAGWDRTIRLWDMATRRQRAVLRGHTASIPALAFTPDGKTLLTGGAGGDQSVRCWDLSTGQDRGVLLKIEETSAGVDLLVPSPDGTMLATPGDKWGTVTVWDRSTGRKRATFTGHDCRAVGATFSPDGESLAIIWAGNEGVGLYDIAGAERTRNLGGGSLFVASLAYSPDGKLLATACCTSGVWNSPGLLVLWDPSTGRELARVVGHSRPIRCVAFSPDGKVLATGSVDRTDAVKFWPLTRVIRRSTPTGTAPSNRRGGDQ